MEGNRGEPARLENVAARLSRNAGPPHYKPSIHRPTPMRNPNNVCFLNSFFQLLSASSLFLEWAQSLQRRVSLVGPVLQGVADILCALGERRDPTRIIYAWLSENFPAYFLDGRLQQQDATELINVLTPEEFAFCEFDIDCETWCNGFRTDANHRLEESHTSLSLSVDDGCIQGGMMIMFNPQETDGVACEDHLPAHSDRFRRLSMVHGPQILFVTLKRFLINSQNELQKVSTPIDISLSLAVRCVDASGKESFAHYDLLGVVAHLGQDGEGHNVCATRREDG